MLVGIELSKTSTGIKDKFEMDNKLQTAAERAGLTGRRTIRKAPGGKSEGPVCGIWDIQTRPGTRADALKSVYMSALNSVDAAEARKASALSSGKYTAEGAKSDVLAFAAQKLAPVLHRGRQVVESAKREVAERRAALKPAPIDKTDFAGALLRSEMRGWLASKSQKERDEFVRDNLDKLDPEMARAFTEMPAEVSGISPVQRDLLADRALEAAHPGELAEITQLERAIQLAERAVELGRGEIAKDAEVSQDDFNAIASAYENDGVAWLRKRGDKIVVADLARGVEREPTPQELETGIHFKDYQEYAAANGLPPEPQGA